ncbi:maleylacetoacetate isomerase [Pseudooceanicola nitratireducens]|jgi:maleylpyruvate isomerase|uniref:Maleylacetoacetate isomerase n=1 Tax=Pseudooceanicola nitratireducens TaxID=517719 RepID=A0A1I1MF81_9RHOB|nr:maleylacetoacetate isomerase [Pseudooceanicola nitratireducens]SEI91154.1 maleylpyruvate isomerase [Pseudooceanicola nitratireducens]SFC80260.1 maleylacetoacetate isomerase [Pseudooceanicola nitratireducens]
MDLRLHNFFRSSTSTRVRAALNLKGLPYEYVPYVLRDGETRTPAYLGRNPQGLVPTLERGDGVNLTQSLAIIEWLDEVQPEPPLLPRDPDDRAWVRSLSYMIACEIHPLNNLRVLFRLCDQFGADDEAQKEWFTHWVSLTFDALEDALAKDPRSGRCCFGDTPTMADVCLYAQVWNNRRFAIPLDRWPTIRTIFEHLETLPAFAKAAPPRQPDAA